MRIRKRGWLAGMALMMAAALALGSAVTQSGTAAAQAGGSTPVASIGCAPGGGSWTDCTLTLNQYVPAGQSVVVSLADPSVSVGFCWGGTNIAMSTTSISPSGDYSSSDSISPGCFTDGHETTFNCTEPCAAGSNFIVSVLGSPSSNLAQSLSASIG